MGVLSRWLLLSLLAVGSHQTNGFLRGIRGSNMGDKSSTSPGPLGHDLASNTNEVRESYLPQQPEVPSYQQPQTPQQLELLLQVPQQPSYPAIQPKVPQWPKLPLFRHPPCPVPQGSSYQPKLLHHCHVPRQVPQQPSFQPKQPQATQQPDAPRLPLKI